MKPTDQIQEVTFRDYIDLILRRKWTIIISFFVVFSAAVYYNFTQPPIYESVATFIIESNEPVIPLMNGVKMSEPARPFEFYHAVVTSRVFREKAARQIRADLADSANLNITHTDAWNLLVHSLDVINPEYSDFVELHAKANDPQVAYILAKVTASALKERCQEIDQEESMNVVKFVTSQKNKAETDLEDIEKKLQQFKESPEARIAGENGGLVKKLINMEGELLNIQTQRELAESNLKEYEEQLKKLNLKVDQSLDKTELPTIQRLKNEIVELEDVRNGLLQVTGKNTELASLEQKIEEKKKDLVREMLLSTADPNMKDDGSSILWEKLLEQKVTEELNVAALTNREAFYTNLIENFRIKHPNILEHEITLNRLERAKEVHQSLHSFLLEKGEEAKIKAATGTGGIRIVDPPNWPSKANAKGTQKNLALGFLLGIGLGIGLAFLREYLDNTIRTPDDITNFLKLPVMGVIPFIKAQNGFHTPVNGNGVKLELERSDYSRSSRLITKLSAKDPIVESYRGLRTNLQFAEVDKKVRSILVTSSRPEEGKTISAANLALAFAEIGQKVVLVDADLRKPKLHTLFGINREPGLMECLVGEKSIHEVMYSQANENLQVIPAGKVPPNPTQILASQKMKTLIKTLEHENDIVIFDSPPLAAVTDPVLMGTQVDGVILVVRFEFTEMNIARNSMTLLNKSRAKILGVVLNSTEFARGYGYYNQYYNYYHYYNEYVKN